MHALSRREFVTSAVVASAFRRTNGKWLKRDATQVRLKPDATYAGVKALVFDVFGTVVDWRTSVAREVQQLAKRKGLTIDGEKFADAWRAGYGPSMNRVRTGELPWTKLD